MNAALHWSTSRSAVRNAVCEKGEKYIERAFDRHVCHDTDACPLNLLENIVTRYVQFHIENESTDVALLSMPVKK